MRSEFRQTVMTLIFMQERLRGRSRFREMKTFPSTSTSIRVRKKQSSASPGSQTTGSFSLNDVFSSIGTPVMSRNAAISRWYIGLLRDETV